MSEGEECASCMTSKCTEVRLQCRISRESRELSHAKKAAQDSNKNQLLAGHCPQLLFLNAMTFFAGGEKPLP